MKIPYALTAAMPVEQRHAQMALAISLNLPRLRPRPIDPLAAITIVGYGPSLQATWPTIRTLGHPILSMSGATKFLAARGIVPDFHLDMDPRAQKAKHIDPPVPGVHYLMATVCPPQTWTLLRDQRVTIWHVYSGTDTAGRDTYDWVAEHDDPQELVIHGGSTVGLTALHLAGVLGYRHFEIFGMDGSFAAADRQVRHAGPHYGHAQNKDGITWDAGGVTYATSQVMANAVAETLNTLKNFPIFAVFHGEGLTQALVREAGYGTACAADQVEQADRVRRSIARIIDLPQIHGKGHVASLWDALLSHDAAGTWLSAVLTIAREAPARRARAAYNTGTVPVETALLLRALTAYYRPKVAVEIGTFIGTSTLAIAADHVFTCDRDNDCLPSTDRIHCHPHTTSTTLLRALVDRGVSVDFFFFDGRLQPGDCALIGKLAHPGTIYAFDDYTGIEKGVINAGMLMTQLPQHLLIEPPAAFRDRGCTLAALIPTGRI